MNCLGGTDAKSRALEKGGQSYSVGSDSIDLVLIAISSLAANSTCLFNFPWFRTPTHRYAQSIESDPSDPIGFPN
ncbi:hypothetical protein SAMN05216332_103155 [Nitrosospira briensis]|nr:hypothetical protein SAMN05216332_103155 [Nitrosospira briensis]